MYFIYKISYHFFNSFKVGNNPVFKRMLRRESFWRVINHVLCFMTNSQNTMSALFNSYNRRLVDYNTFTRHSN